MGNEWIIVYLHNGILYSHKNGFSIDIFPRHCLDWNKLEIRVYSVWFHRKYSDKKKIGIYITLIN